MKRSIIFLALTFAAVLLAASVPAQTAPEDNAVDKAWKTGCPKLAFSSVEKPKAMRRSFSAAQSADLILHVLFDSGLDRDHVVTVKVFTPKGHLYRTFDVPVASGMDKRAPGARNLPGYPYPVPVHTTNTITAKGRKYESVDITFPVAGSSIVTSSLYGRWEVEVSLDKAVEPCGRRTFFFLRE